MKYIRNQIEHNNPNFDSILIKEGDIFKLVEYDDSKSIEIRWKDNPNDLTAKNTFDIKFDYPDILELFVCKLWRIAQSLKNPTLSKRLDTARIKAIYLDKQLNRLIHKNK